jgi:hypothetical protein
MSANIRAPAAENDFAKILDILVPSETEAQSR